MNLNLADIGKFAFNPKVETFDEMQDSFFKDVYLSAEKCIEDILRQNSSYKKNSHNSVSQDNNGAEHSNIVAFTGGRGSGKTSAMLSVSNLLKDNQKIDGKAYQDVDKFVVLDMIDPSNITAQETVTDVVLSRIYTCFEKERDERIKKGEVNEITQEHTRKVYRAFDEAYQAVRMACHSRENRYELPSGLEGLSNIAAGNKMRNLIQKLVEAVFCAFSDNVYSKARPCFVLCVDDVDMNIGQGYEICEDLRKYFSIPGVIILFSINTDQMCDVVRQRYVSDFKTLLDRKDYNKTAELIPNMAAKYMEKLIPFGRRCSLPDMRIANIKKFKITDDENERMLADEILWLVFNKTGLLLIKNDFGTHAIIPSSLRSAMHLLHTLNSMKDVHLFPQHDQLLQDTNSQSNSIIISRFKYPDSPTRIELAKNLDTLLHFIHEYDLNELSPSESARILEQLSIWPHSTLNKHIHRLFLDEIEKNEVLFNLLPVLRLLTEQSVPPQSITMGDLFGVARRYANTVHNSDVNGRFFALFKIIYSIRTLQCFFIEPSENDNPKNAKMQLYKFLGGLVFSPLIDSIIAGQDWRSDLLLEAIDNFKADPDEYDNLLDSLLIRTIYIGKPDVSLQLHEWVGFRLEHAGAYYSDVKRENLMGGRGNTFKYFTYSPLGFVLSPLRDELNIRNADYKQWIEKYISPIPVFSSDFVDSYVQKLKDEIDNATRGKKAVSSIISEGTISLTKKLLKNSQLPSGVFNWLINGLEEFPYTIGQDLLEDFLSNATTRQQRASYNLLPDSESERVVQLESIRIYIERLQNAMNKYRTLQENVSLVDFRNAIGIALQGNKLLGKEKARGRMLNEEIRKIKSVFFATPNRVESDYHKTIARVINLIENELRSIE